MRLAVPSVHKGLLCVVTDSNNLDFRVLYLAGLSILRFLKSRFQDGFKNDREFQKNIQTQIIADNLSYKSSLYVPLKFSEF